VPMPRRYEPKIHLLDCHRCRRRLTVETPKLLRTILRAHLRTCPETIRR
jgi:hypothetical protein